MNPTPPCLRAGHTVDLGIEASRTMIEPQFTRHGFLPDHDPLTEFPPGSNLVALDRLGRDLASLLQEKSFRARARAFTIPALPAGPVPLPELRLYYVRVGFLASAYINQVSLEPATLLPRNIAMPLCDVCARLERPPILSYDGYALYNWKRFDPAGPIALGNIDTIQNFVHLYDEHWFILVHVEIEALAAGILEAIDRAARALGSGDHAGLGGAFQLLTQTLWAQIETLRRIPEKMDPALYYKTFRPYIRFFEGVVYEGVDSAPLDYRGETGAQSSVIPTIVAFLKVPHKPSLLTNHVSDMRRFMPSAHRALIEQVERLPDTRGKIDKAAYNEALEALATFREVHLEFARRYIASHVRDPRGTGGTPYLEWLNQLIDETRSHMLA
jgi:indoleamine 2,3-dioxygenase